MDRLCNSIRGGIDSYYTVSVTSKFELSTLPKKIEKIRIHRVGRHVSCCCMRRSRSVEAAKWGPSGPVHQIHLTWLSVPTMKSCTRAAFPPSEGSSSLSLSVEECGLSSFTRPISTLGMANWTGWRSRRSPPLMMKSGRFVRLKLKLTRKIASSWRNRRRLSQSH